MNKNYKFLTKKIILTAASVGLAVTLVGCPELESFLSEKQSTPTNTTSSTISTAETIKITEQPSITETETSSYEETTITIAKPTGVEDYYDEVIPITNLKLDVHGDKFLNWAMEYNVEWFGAALGFDNPEMINNLRKIANEPNLNLSEVGYFQDSIAELSSTPYSDRSYFKRKEEPSNQLYSSIASYVLSKNNERQFIDEIRTSFLKENFPEYFDLVNISGKSALLDKNLKKILPECHSLEDFINKIKENNLENKLPEYMNKLLLYSCIDYNEQRGKLVFSYNIVEDKKGQKKVIYVLQGTTPDGRHVLLPTQNQYDYLMSDIKYCDCLSDVKNLYEPITEENLRNGGLDYDLYEHYFNDVLSIDFNIDNSKYVYQQQDNATRSRTS